MRPAKTEHSHRPREERSRLYALPALATMRRYVTRGNRGEVADKGSRRGTIFPRWHKRASVIGFVVTPSEIQAADGRKIYIAQIAETWGKNRNAWSAAVGESMRD